MGKIRVKTLGLEEVEKEQAEKAKARRDAKTLRRTQGKELKKGKDITEETVETLEKETEPQAEPKAGQETVSEKKETKTQSKKDKKVKEKKRGKNYQRVSSEIKKETKYGLQDALKLLKKLTYTKFDETVELHINLKEGSVKGEVSLPHGTGKTVRVVVFDDNLVQDIEKGTINFDILIARPSDMPKLAKFAKILGPKGLMPNPKVGTVSDEPEKALKKFEKGTIRYKSESSAPLVHQAVGKLSLAEKDLAENISVFLSAVGKKNISQVFLKSTMSPSIRIEV